jgi:two-component system phosphate regulon sensor histidine kinase PhoR
MDAASVIAAVPIPMVIVGPDERVRAANPSARALLGQAVEGRHFLTIMRQPRLVAAVESALNGSGVTGGRFVSTEAGRETHWRVTATPLEEGPRHSVALSFEDTTPVAEAIQSRRDFVANVSHELRTPLTALIGFIETLRGAARDDPAARDRFLGVMEREASRMNRLVADLLSLNRVEAQERIRPTGRVALMPLVDACVSALKPRAAQAGVSVEVEVEGGAEAGTGGDPHHVLGDEDQLQQVFTNLLENALKYGASGGRVLIRAARVADDPRLRGRAVRIEVVDWGEGFDPIHIPRLTERFYRVDGHRARSLGGTGLGLAIVKHIVNRHRGALRIEGRRGEGARFTVLLPEA